MIDDVLWNPGRFLNSGELAAATKKLNELANDPRTSQASIRFITVYRKGPDIIYDIFARFGDNEISYQERLELTGAPMRPDSVYAQSKPK